MQHLPVIELRVLGSKEHEARSHLARLSRPTQLRLLSKALHILSRAGRGLQRRVHGTRSHRINTDALLDQLLREGARERNDSALGGGIIHHRLGTAKRDGRSGIDDAAALPHVRYGVLGHGEHLQDVAAERALDGVQVDVRDVRAHHLLRGVVHQHVDRVAEPVHVLLHCPPARLVVHQVAGDEKTCAPFVLDEPLRLFGVFLLLGQVHDADVGPLAREERRYGAADARATDPVS